MPSKSDRMGKSNFGTKQGGTNTAEGPSQYYDGFYYTLQYDGVGQWTWRVYDSAMGLLYTGTVIGRSHEWQIADSNARDWIDNQNSGDIGDPDYPVVGGDWFAIFSDRCYTVEWRNTTRNAGIGVDLYVWRMKDINGSVIYTQTFPNAETETRKDFEGYLISLPDQEGCDKGGGGGDGDGDGDGDGEGETLGDYTVIGMFALLAVAYVLFEAFKGESPVGS
jgi:hypothetical protein